MCKCEKCKFEDRVTLFCRELNELEQKYKMHLFQVIDGENITVMDGDDYKNFARKKNIEDTLDHITQLANKK